MVLKASALTYDELHAHGAHSLSVMRIPRPVSKGGDTCELRCMSCAELLAEVPAGYALLLAEQDVVSLLEATMEDMVREGRSGP